MLRRTGLLTIALLLSGAIASSVSAFPDGGDPDGGSYPIAAYLCDSDPGNWSPYATRSIGGGCEPLAGVTFSAALESDGIELDTCTTTEDGTCAVDVPGEVQLLITEDVATIPDGYAPRENPVGGYNATEFRGSRVYNLPEGAEVTPSPTAAPATGSPASILEGTCDNADFDTAVADLELVQAPEGVSRGPGVVAEVERSSSTVDLSLDDLFATNHTIAVFDQDDASTVLACGEIAGIVGTDGLLVVPLRAEGESLYSGVATFTNAPLNTIVTIYLAPDLDGSGV